MALARRFQSLKRDIPLCNDVNAGNRAAMAVFQSLKRDIPLCNDEWSLLIHLAHKVSIAQARHPFMQHRLCCHCRMDRQGFNRSSATSLYATLSLISIAAFAGVFQSLKRDIPLCNFGRPIVEMPDMVVSIAQARHPFMQLGMWTAVALTLRRFNRSSATSLYATAMMKFRQAIPMMFQSLKRDIPLCNPSSMRTQAQRVITGTLARGL